jgi:hypothetical protein
MRTALDEQAQEVRLSAKAMYRSGVVFAWPDRSRLHKYFTTFLHPPSWLLSLKSCQVTLMQWLVARSEPASNQNIKRTKFA